MRNKVLLWAAIIISIISVTAVLLKKFTKHSSKIETLTSSDSIAVKNKNAVWIAPDSTAIPSTKEGEMIRYGRDLIAHTSYFLGPKGTVLHLSNGMNCENCHLKAGTKPFGNNYGGVYSTYPKFRERSGTVESICKRVNDCIERSLNGKTLDSTSKEMQAILAYMKWLGEDVKKGEKPKGAGITDLKFLDRASDPANGKIVYTGKCLRCHGADGGGLLNADKNSYTYPPLWGNNSYNTGAGLFRLSRFAGYVKDNMPYGASHDSTQLTDEEAWDVAAFVNSQPRPSKNLSKDYPVIATKPFDYPFGPYADKFSETQHKFGPYAEIKKAKEDAKKKNKPSKS